MNDHPVLPFSHTRAHARASAETCSSYSPTCPAPLILTPQSGQYVEKTWRDRGDARVRSSHFLLPQFFSIRSPSFPFVASYHGQAAQDVVLPLRRSCRRLQRQRLPSSSTQRTKKTFHNNRPVQDFSLFPSPFVSPLSFLHPSALRTKASQHTRGTSTVVTVAAASST